MFLTGLEESHFSNWGGASWPPLCPGGGGLAVSVVPTGRSLAASSVPEIGLLAPGGGLVVPVVSSGIAEWLASRRPT